MSDREKSEEPSNTDEVLEISGKHFEKISEELNKVRIFLFHKIL